MIPKHLYYLLAMVLSVLFPLLFSADKKVNYIQYIKAIVASIFSVAIFFIIGDIIYTKLGVWGFNNKYHLNAKFFELPIEEILFFLFVPYSCLFIYQVLNAYIKQVASKNYMILLGFIAFSSLIIAILNINKMYTSFAFFGFSAISIYLAIKSPHYLIHLIWAYLISTLPFILVNGFLTGMFTPEPIVWYNNDENLGIRFITIPIEDFFYSYNLIVLNIIFFEKFKTKLYHSS